MLVRAARKLLGTALAAGCAILPAASKADVVTFAQFHEDFSRDTTRSYVFRQITSTLAQFATGTLNGSTFTPGSDAILFSYQGIAGLPAPLAGSQSANLTASVTTNIPVQVFGNQLSQPFSSSFTISILRATPYLGHNNLLSVTITPIGVQGGLAGLRNQNFALAGAGNGTDDFMITFTSDFLFFGSTITRDIATSFTAVTPSLNTNGNFLRNFTADATGTFDSDPVPILGGLIVSEPAAGWVMALGIAGLAMARGRRKSSA